MTKIIVVSEVTYVERDILTHSLTQQE